MKNLTEIFISLRVHTIVATIILISLLLVFLMRSDYFFENGFIGLLMIVFLSGSLGGVINNYLRINKLAYNEENKRHNIRLSTKDRVINIMQIYATLFVSGALGIIFYTFLASGLIEGDLFPSFTNLEKVFDGNMGDFFHQVKPENNIDVIKAIVWSFLAGFSEQLVPNSIDNFINKVKLNKSTK
jgi:hypothetical protein